MVEKHLTKDRGKRKEEEKKKGLQREGNKDKERR